MSETEWTPINRTTLVHLSPAEVRQLRAACKVAHLPFAAMACQPTAARELISEVARRAEYVPGASPMSAYLDARGFTGSGSR